MGTIVTIHVVAPDSEAAIDRAFAWFHEIEARCSRFREESELMQLTAQVGAPVPVSPILFEALRFALMVSAESGGAFDVSSGSNRSSGNYRDLDLDAGNQTVTVQRPLDLDLGAVAKGLAVDMAARELHRFTDFAIDAGGDLYLGGMNPEGVSWTVGIRHPRHENQVMATVRASNQAVCTSGDYERGAHIRDPRTGSPATQCASVTVIAPGAMLADALATAAFVLGPLEGIAFLERMEVEGLIITPELEKYQTPTLPWVA
jgi:thiamine biosynthesis lipoprotein